MSRVRVAALTASFNYIQYAVAIVSGLLLVPLTIGAVGTREYGLWLATGELLGYAGMVDFGVLGVMPWVIAEADGRRDRAKIRDLVANGVSVGAVVGGAYLALAALLWTMLPSVVNVTDAEREALARPLLLVVMVTAAAYPLRTFTALLTGLQDAVFNGLLTIVQSAVYIVVALIGLTRGWGLYALALASAISTTIAVVAALVRTAFIAPDLLTAWPRPRFATIRALLTNGAGVWVAGFGWRLVAASTNTVIALVGRTEWIAVYACTSKVSALATQLTWVLPDSGLIGLSQVHGEAQSPERLRRVVQMILRLHLVLAGATACAVLTGNAAFVKVWVGAEFYGGHALNMWLAAGIIAASLAHGLMTTASVLGNRLQVGAATLAHGIVQTTLAFVLGTWWALGGIAAAALVAAFVTSAPAGLALLAASTGLSFGSFLRDLLWPALHRIGPPLLVSAAAGVLTHDAGLAVAGGVTAVCLCGYLRAARPLLSELPLGERWTRTLVRARLLPPPAAVAVEPL